ncbi:MAG: hypothetical protein L6R41_000106 [Letrouitia leprolyta]|nr:MAG: hypothetical protein L6R41_000106 [Letrouitia leprolyta]
MMETIRRAEERQALQAAGIPPANEFIPIESQPNGLLMASAPQAQEPSSAFQFNDLSMALPGFDPNEKSLNEQSSVPQANGGDMTNPVFNGGHALVSDGVSDHSSSFLTLASVGISNHSSPFPGGAGLALGGCSDHSTPFPAPPEPLPDIYRPLPDFIPPQFPPFGNDGAMAPPAEAFFPNDLLNLCKCGPNCQCEMCAVHPYNPTAQSHMQDLANFMVSDLGNPGPFYNEAFPGPPYSSGADAGLLGNLGGLTEGTGDGQLTMNGYHTNVDIDGDDIDSNAYPDGGITLSLTSAQPSTAHADAEKIALARDAVPTLVINHNLIEI